MSEYDPNDALPESDMATWTCPICGARQQGVASLLVDAECPGCQEAFRERIYADWFDFRDAVEREAG